LEILIGIIMKGDVIGKLIFQYFIWKICSLKI